MLTESECIDMGMNPVWWYGMGKGAESRFEAIECRIAAMERKLSHKTREDE